ncbi:MULTISPECIES: hypothetical protein [Sphingobacterium]|uniref:hypothetical protein n=1 Tax=Sphingobacterium TaxID=28453 RepID=UPI002580853D|nr:MULTISPECIES: hypothetical protein [Sphingobacterium]
MKIGKIYKSLILIGLLLVIKPSFAISQQVDVTSQSSLMSDKVLQYVVIGLAITVLLVLIFMMIQTNSRNRVVIELERRIDSFQKQPRNDNQQQLRPQVSSSLPRYSNDDNNILKKQVQELTEKFETLARKVDGILLSKPAQISSTAKNNDKDIGVINPIIERTDTRDGEIPSEPITLSVPQQQEFVADCLTGGAFQDLRSVSRRDRRTPYIISKRENEYYFRLDETNLDAIATSIQHRDSYVDGFCESLNNYFPGAKSFTQESKLGRLQLVEDKLQVVEKIKIRYS